MSLKKFFSNPFSYSKLVINKLIFQPLVYKKGKEYDAGNYWANRLGKYGTSLKGPGDEGLTEQDNLLMYEKDKSDFIAFIQTDLDKFREMRVLEIGCGTGFYTNVLHELGAENVTCLDITDVLFSELKTKYPKYNFRKGDVSSEKISDTYDIILFIDVLEHIVLPEKFDFAIKNIRNALSANGSLFITPLYEETKKVSFYVHSWTLEDVTRVFGKCTVEKTIPFRYTKMAKILPKV